MTHIFNIGSCRSDFRKHSNLDYINIPTFDYVHTTKELLIHLDFIQGKKNIHDYPNLNWLMHMPRQKDFRKKCIFFLKSDIITIEISSFKIYKKDGCYYQINRSIVNNKKMVDFYRQSEEEFAKDIQEIYQRINKPIIFIGHLNLYFDNIKGVDGYIKERQLLDEYIKKYCKHYILPSDVFKGYNYTDILDFRHRPNDTKHLTHDAKNILYNSVYDKIKILFGKS